MPLSNKEILYSFAEETAYSSKGHFKTADWLRQSLMFYIVIPFITSAITLVFQVPEPWQRIVSFAGFLFSFFALVSVWSSNRDKADLEIRKHMELGNKYLSIHKEIRILSAQSGELSSEKIQDLSKRINELDQETTTCTISFVGRWWSKIRINSEMDLDWLKK